MANSIYPHNAHTLPAIQKIDFINADGSRMTAVLNPHPRLPGVHITHVILDCTSVHWSNALVSQHATVLEAGAAAHQAAQSFAASISTRITEVRSTGDEFLDRPDIEAITGNQYQISVV